MTGARALVRSALAALGIRRLLLGVHDAALPGDPSDDAGRGAPLSRGGLDFLQFAHDLGFDGIQLGPQGKTSDIDASPYDGTLFSRSTLSLALGPLHAEGILPEDAFRMEFCAEFVPGNYRFVELPGVTHWIPEQAPRELATAILDRIASAT